MAADTYDSILGLILQGTGSNNNWGAVANNSMISPAARAIAGVNEITNTGGTVDLSTTILSVAIEDHRGRRTHDRHANSELKATRLQPKSKSKRPGRWRLRGLWVRHIYRT
jgi:hypothetical protein